MPRPGIACTAIASSVAVPACRACAAMARSTGCGERAATAAAVASTVLASTPSMGRTSTTLRTPCVSVPVLSTATAAMAARRSRCRPPLISTPCRAAAASADTIEIGVLSTSAHGQAMTSSTSAR